MDSRCQNNMDSAGGDDVTLSPITQQQVDNPQTMPSFEAAKQANQLHAVQGS